MNIVVGLFLFAVLSLAIVLFCIAAVSRSRPNRSSRHNDVPASYDQATSTSYNVFTNSGTLLADGHAAAGQMQPHSHSPTHIHPHTLDHTSHHHHVGDPAWDSSHSGSGSFDSGSLGGDSGGGGDGGGGGGGD